MEQWREELAEIRAIMKENAKGFAELKELQRKNEEERKKNEEERKKNEEESAKKFAKLRKEIRNTSKNIGGISNRNSKMAEQFFYNSLKKTKTLGGVHFDYILRNLSNMLYKDEKTLKGEYDIVMTNEVASCIIEVKYTVELKDVKKLVDEQVNNFKVLFPEHTKPKVYLGIGGMAFDGNAEETAKEYGMAILKPNGNAVEVFDDNLKVY